MHIFRDMGIWLLILGTIIMAISYSNRQDSMGRTAITFVGGMILVASGAIELLVYLAWLMT